MNSPSRVRAAQSFACCCSQRMGAGAQTSGGSKSGKLVIYGERHPGGNYKRWHRCWHWQNSNLSSRLNSVSYLINVMPPPTPFPCAGCLKSGDMPSM